MSFSFLLILLSLFSFQGTMLLSFLKLKVQYLNFCLNTEVWVLTSFIHFCGKSEEVIGKK